MRVVGKETQPAEEIGECLTGTWSDNLRFPLKDAPEKGGWFFSFTAPREGLHQTLTELLEMRVQVPASMF